MIALLIVLAFLVYNSWSVSLFFFFLTVATLFYTNILFISIVLLNNIYTQQFIYLMKNCTQEGKMDLVIDSERFYLNNLLIWLLFNTYHKGTLYLFNYLFIWQVFFTVLKSFHFIYNNGQHYEWRKPRSVQGNFSNGILIHIHVQVL